VNAVLSRDKDGKDKFLALDDELAQVVLDGFAEHSSGTAVLATGASVTVPFGALGDARGVLLRATGDFNLALNGGAPLSIRRGVSVPGGALAETSRVFLEALLTSVVVTAVTDLTLTYAVWGDPT
jgi:hypothetical protein